MYEIFCDNCGTFLGVLPAKSIDNPDNIPECSKCPFSIKGVYIKLLGRNQQLTVNSIKIFSGNKRRGKYPAESIKKYQNKYSLTGEVQTIERVFDREKDKYLETIVNKDGEVVKKVQERLTKHRGHGKAKQK